MPENLDHNSTMLHGLDLEAPLVEYDPTQLGIDDAEEAADQAHLLAGMDSLGIELGDEESFTVFMDELNTIGRHLAPSTHENAGSRANSDPEANEERALQAAYARVQSGEAESVEDAVQQIKQELADYLEAHQAS